MSEYDERLRATVTFYLVLLGIIMVVGFTARSLEDRHAKLTNKIKEVSDGSGN